MSIKYLMRENFLEYYHLTEIFENSGCDWDTLNEIYLDYNQNHFLRFQKIAEQLVGRLEKDKPDQVRAIYGRAKDPEHLIEKIIRKNGQEFKSKYKDINKENYLDIVTDLIGIRILVLAKEEWKQVDLHIRSIFKEFFEHTPIAYVCYGDREIFDSRSIYVDYTNKGYRSQHYVVKYEHVFCEIQVRTLAEEVYGEFDHRIRYPYRTDNKFLVRYSKIVSKCTAELDDLVSSCLDMGEESWDVLNKQFKKDRYVDWNKGVQTHKDGSGTEEIMIDPKVQMDAKTVANEILTRKRE